MWFLLFLVCVVHTELGILHVQGKHQLILRGEGAPCHGHVEVYFKSKWGYVGDQNWNSSTEEVVCRSTHCGSPVAGSTKDVYIPMDASLWLNEVKCNGSENNLWECNYPGLGISVSRKDRVKSIRCSNKINITLDGSQCEGAVQFFIEGETKAGYFCDGGWGPNEADFLCESLGCGKHKAIALHKWNRWKEFENSKKMMINCSDIKPLNNLWQCVTQETTCKNPASVTCKGYERLQLKGTTQNVCSGQLEREENGTWVLVKNDKNRSDLWCKQMHCGSALSWDDNSSQLTCKDNVKVVLMDRGSPSNCYGAVHVVVNGVRHSVCASTWNKEEAQVICRELNCGNVITYKNDQKPTETAIIDRLTCMGSESSLWHCRGTHGIGLKCSSNAYVVCAGSVSVKLKDGTGKCAGRLEIQYEGKWQQVYENGLWTDTNSDVVCRQMNCGKKQKSSNPQKFCGGSAAFLSMTVECKSNASTISECLTGKPTNKPSKIGAVGIICEEHKIVYLQGDSPCSGMVGIEHGSNAYWLSGSNATWNQESANAVCHQRHCGKASAFSATNSKAHMQNDVWEKSYNCSPSTKSLFECDTGTQSSDHSDTIATVKCAGKIKTRLTDNCWGTVNFCFEEVCGSVCADTWTHSHSLMLCKNLGCGHIVLQANKKPSKEKGLLKSVTMMNQPAVNKRTQYNFVMNDDHDYTCEPAYVVCSGSVKPRFSVSSYKCSGNIEVFYEGNWLLVSMDALKKKEQDTICEELECGQAVNKIFFFGPKPAQASVISQLQCPKNGPKSLSACNITSSITDSQPAGLQCTKYKKMEVSETCSGAVSVHSNGKRHAVAFEGWTETEGQRLCQDLKCGSYKSKKVFNTTQTQSFLDSTFSCGNDTKNIWDCEKPAPPSQEQQLFIECQDEPKVTLSEKCHGKVKISGMAVSSSHWNLNYAHLLCQEKECSNAIYSAAKYSKINTDCYYVKCDDFHHKLSQCRRVQGKCNGPVVYVYCVGNVKFNTTEKCGGQLLVNYNNYWEKICPVNLSLRFKKKLCEELGCRSHDDSEHKRDKEELVTLETALDCTPYHNDIKHCVTHSLCADVRPAEIYCSGYEPVLLSQPESPRSSLISIILGVGLFLVLVILIIIFIRICIVKKAKNVMNIPAIMMSRKEVEFESGDYEEVTGENNETEDFTHGKSRTEAEVITKNNAPSTSSFSYDDIDESVEAQPLTSQPTTTIGASKVSHKDVVTYEVEDSQDSYDDIDTCTEITQIKAEVHNRPKTTCESNTVGSPGLEQEDANYLVPGQDG